MKMDIYNCEECTHAFAVEHDVEPTGCPVCDGELFEFSHEVFAVQKGIKIPSTPKKRCLHEHN